VQVDKRLTRFGSCPRVAGRSTRHDPLARPSTRARPARSEPLPAQSIMPPLRGPVDSSAALRGSGSYRMRHRSDSASWLGRNDGHEARSPGMDRSRVGGTMRDLRRTRDPAVTTREAVPLDLCPGIDRGAPPGRRARAPRGVESAAQRSQRVVARGHPPSRMATQCRLAPTVIEAITVARVVQRSINRDHPGENGDGHQQDSLHAQQPRRNGPSWKRSLDASVVPHPCQNGREPPVISGHARSRLLSDLGRGSQRGCPKRPSKQRVSRRQACPPDVPEPPSTVNSRHQQQPVNLKLARASSLRATHENTLVMRRPSVRFR
jgi:hypothetical protein